MALRYQILDQLSDGRFHSGQALGNALGVSRAAVWKHIQGLSALGVEVQAVTGRGYRLARPLELLDADAIRTAMSPGARHQLVDLEVHHQIDSTNTHLLQRRPVPRGGAYACLAEQQLSGRGRRGRAWCSPFGGNIYLSLAWRYKGSPATVTALGLAAGCAVAQALQEAGADDIGLKWPNDIMWRGHKLAGVLLEMSGESAGPCHVVIGVGINVRMIQQPGIELDQAWVDMETVTGAPVSRNRLAGRLVEHLLEALARYQARGLPAFTDQWRALDQLTDRWVEVRFHDGAVTGQARGVDDAGALLVTTADGSLQRYQAGDVSLRPQSPA